MYPGRGVLHTPHVFDYQDKWYTNTLHKMSLQGDGIYKRRPNVRLFVPYGAIR